MHFCSRSNSFQVNFKRMDSMDGKKGKDFSRRNFLKMSGKVVIGTSVATVLPNLIWLDEGLAAIPASEGYLLVDVKKCQGCMSCMLACSLVHEGVESPSLARIQVIQNAFQSFPDDLTVEQCRQCVTPACVEACPTGALQADPKRGNVRIVNKQKCIGCGACMEACPFTPSRAYTAPDNAFDGQPKSRKCDLCATAPYHWDPAGGGPKGKQACVEVCPVSAIKFVKEIPEQEGTKGYKVNLRDQNWRRLGYPVD